jgi:uracil phosphoribosyltransferase
MKVQRMSILAVILSLATFAPLCAKEGAFIEATTLEELVNTIQINRDNEEALSQLLPIVRCSFKFSKYEQVLISQLRDVQTNTNKFRNVSERLAAILVNKVVECLPSRGVEIETPVTKCMGEEIGCPVELVSVMRSGDALMDTFIKHFPEANVSKFLVQRDEITAEPHFKYKKVSPGLTSGCPVVITEPMIATGGSLDMVLSMLIEIGVREDNIIIASVCTAPEGLARLSRKYPQIKVVMTAFDERLNERKYIVPGLGDFGDRFFGTQINEND